MTLRFKLLLAQSPLALALLLIGLLAISTIGRLGGQSQTILKDLENLSAGGGPSPRVYVLPRRVPAPFSCQAIAMDRFIRLPAWLALRLRSLARCTCREPEKRKGICSRQLTWTTCILATS